MTKVYAPIDNKNLMEDVFEDDVFRDFYAAPDHEKNHIRHLIGFVNMADYDQDMLGIEGYVDVQWHFGDSAIVITVVGYNPCENALDVRDAIFNHYEQTFRKWACPENDDLHVGFRRAGYKLEVSFWWECED